MKKMKRVVALFLCLTMIVNIFEFNGTIVNATKTNDQIVYEYLIKEMKLNHAAACGVLANMEREASFNPKAVGDHGTSYGICQWHNGRWTRMEDYCKRNKLDSTGLEGQLSYLQYELKTYYGGVWNSLKNAQNTKDGAFEAAKVWCIDFEVPANKFVEAENRGEVARTKYWNKYYKFSNKISSATVTNIKNNSVTFNAELESKGEVTKWGIFYGTSESAIKGVDLKTKHSSTDKYKYYLMSEYSSGKAMSSFKFNTEKTKTVSNKRIKLSANTSYYYKIVCKVDDEWVISSKNSFKTANEAPAKVTGVTLTSRKLGRTDTPTLTWNKSVDATGYVVKLLRPNGTETTLAKDLTKATYKIPSTYTNKEGEYTLSVFAKNDSTKLSAAATKTYTVYPDVTVKFLSNTGKTIKSSKIHYGKAAIVPNVQDSDASTHVGWKLQGKADSQIVSDFSNIKADTTYVEVRSSKSYTVKYVDSYTGKTIKNVKYLYGATVSKEDYPIAPDHENYQLTGWSENKFTVKGNRTVNAIYEWNNADQLAVQINSITRAKSKVSIQENDGYNIALKLTIPKAETNDNTVKGRVVVALKTKAGRLLIETESSAFVLYPKNGAENSKEMEVFVPYVAGDEALAYSAEVYVVNDYQAGGIITTPKTDTTKMQAANTNEYQYSTDEDSIPVELREKSKDYTVYDWTKTTTTTKESLAASLSGYTCLKNQWVKVNSGTIDYVKSWPSLGSGKDKHFNNTDGTGKTLYNKYHKSPKAASESTNSKVTISEKVQGYIYYHWCRNRNNEHFGHKTLSTHSTSGGNEYGTFHAFEVTSRLSQTTATDLFGDTKVYSKKNESVCKDSKYWRKEIPIYRQTWNQYTKKYTHKRVTTVKGSTRNASEVPKASSSTSTETVNSVLLNTSITNSVSKTETKYYAYRYASNSTGHEDKNKYNLSGTVGAAYAGQDVVVYVYKDKQMSDYTTEYVGMHKVDSEGNINVSDAQLREACTIETGDFTIAVAVKNETDAIVVGTIEAPKPTYTVKYVADIDGEEQVIDVQSNIKEGSDAIEPEEALIPEKKGYHFAGWSMASNNIKDDMTIEAVYDIDTYKVVYVDWVSQTVEMKDYDYGESLDFEDLPQTEEGIDVKWVIGDGTVENPETLEDFINSGKTVEGDMVISTRYDLEKYTVTVVKAEKNRNVADVITPENCEEIGYDTGSGQEEDSEISVDAQVENVECGDVLQLEKYEDAMEEDDEIVFSGWVNAETGELLDDIEVTDNMTIYPVYTFAETTEEPKASIETGEYDKEQTVSLSTGTEDAVIYYTTDGSDPKTSKTAKEYKGEIKLTKSTELKYYACSFGRNDSEVKTNLYAINTATSGAKYHVVTFIANIRYTGTILIKESNTLKKEMFDDIEGYELSKVYYDQDEKVEFFLGAELVTESCTLYLNYTEKTYTVKFHDYVGNVVKTENVPYMGTATAPVIGDVEGYKFVGWNQDISNVRENMEVTPKYIPENEYATISLNKKTAGLLCNKSIQLKYTLDAEQVTDEVIEWSSSDETVAIVNDEGIVTGVGEGTANITARVVSSNETDVCRVICNRDLDTQIIIEDNSFLEYSNEYIRSIKEKISLEEAQKQFKNEQLAFRNVQYDVTNSKNYIGTGTKIELWDGDNLLDEKQMIVLGDVSGDGLISNMDVSMLTRFVLEKENISYVQQLASDVNGDGVLNNRDVSMLQRYLVGKEVIK